MNWNELAPADLPFGVYSVGGGKFIAKFCGLVLCTGTIEECRAELRAKGCEL